jgi:pimeloyl-ACP methyl ester carboxylesterase
MPLSSRVSGAPVSELPPRAARVLYLHGFASSSRSTKASFFGDRLREHGIAMGCPDFNEPDFATLTLTRMLDRLGAELAADDVPATVIGSSLGGTLAILAAAKHAARVNRLVLMAPAVMFAKPGHHLLPPERIEEWRRRGALPFFHYGDGTERDLDFGFYEDSLLHDAFAAEFEQPTLVFQGVRDASVDYRTVEAFAKTRPNVTLALLDDDHQLVASLPRMWADMRAFLGVDT